MEDVNLPPHIPIRSQSYCFAAITLIYNLLAVTRSPSHEIDTSLWLGVM